MSWFSNRGQIIQIVCAVIAVLVAVMTWLAISPYSVISVFSPSTLAPIAAGVLAYFGASFLSYLVGRRKQGDTDPSGMFADDYEPFSVGSVDKEPGIKKLRYGLVRITTAIGKRLEFKIEDRDFTVIVHGLVEKDTNSPRAEIEIVDGTGPLRGGSRTKRITSTRYYIPVNSLPSRFEDNCVSYVDLNEYRFRFFFLVVEHINIHGNEVTFVVCASTQLL